MTVAIEDDHGTVVAYGVMADISGRGGCVQTDVLIVSDATFNLRLSFAYPPEIHDVVARIAWSRSDAESAASRAYCCGIEWVALGHTLRCRLRQLTREALRAGGRYRFVFNNKWVVNATEPSPGSPVVSPWSDTLWSPSGPETRPLTVSDGVRAAVSSASAAGHERTAVLRFPPSHLKQRDQ